MTKGGVNSGFYFVYLSIQSILLSSTDSLTYTVQLFTSHYTGIEIEKHQLHCILIRKGNKQLKDTTHGIVLVLQILQ